MNRHARRAAAARARRKFHTDLYHHYIKHLLSVPIDAQIASGRVHHLSFHHDSWCRFYSSGDLDHCNSNPIITRHVEPERS
jgi:hypothetical protein